MFERTLGKSTDAALEKYFQKNPTKSSSISVDAFRINKPKRGALPVTESTTAVERSITPLDSIKDEIITKPSITTIEGNLKVHIMSIVANTINHIFECESPESDGRNTNLPTLDDFIHRIYRKANLSITNLLTALLFLIRLKEYHPSCKGAYGSGHRLFLSAIIIANKYLYDGAYHNVSWVRLVEGRYSLGEINQMECELLGLLKYQLVVKKDDWIEYSRIIDTKLEKSWLRRGFGGPEKYLLEKLIKNIDWPLSPPLP
ncbi:hypothetical protein K7432_002075 [Basidiobolus ranarum]|uniref:Cyclin N-terminal domain-containing protein n=1 Tax=Basidiobolus ranarum TaxID=34480 RepID=A0ABR2W8H3_9FUNG